MPETIKPPEGTPEKTHQPEAEKSLDPIQGKMVTGLENTLHQTAKLGADPESMDRLRTKATSDLLKFVTAKSVYEWRKLDSASTKASIRAKAGPLFQLNLQQEFITPMVAEAVLGPKEAKLGNAQLEISTTPGVILGTQKNLSSEKSRSYFGYQLKNKTLSVTFLGEFDKDATSGKEKNTTNARMKANYSISKDMGLFADVTVAGINQPNKVNLDSIQAVLGMALPEDKVLAFEFNPKKGEAMLSFVGSF